MRIIRNAFAFLALLPLAAIPSGAQSSGSSGSSSSPGYFADWFNRVDKTQAEQPHWATPLATTTPRLEEEFRYDILRQTNNSGITTENYGGAKGLELIPAERIEVILSSNEEHGKYILTAFFQTTFPTGQYKNGATDTIITPTIAYGKGFGDFDIQGTFGVTLPTGNENNIGHTYPWNNAFQYHLYRKFWPEVEVNYTHFQDGPNNGKTQVYMTPGLVIGRLHLYKRLALTVGGGFQIATTRFHTNNHNGIVSIRFPF